MRSQPTQSAAATFAVSMVVGGLLVTFATGTLLQWIAIIPTLAVGAMVLRVIAHGNRR